MVPQHSTRAGIVWGTSATQLPTLASPPLQISTRHPMQKAHKMVQGPTSNEVWKVLRLSTQNLK